MFSQKNFFRVGVRGDLHVDSGISMISLGGKEEGKQSRIGLLRVLRERLQKTIKILHLKWVTQTRTAWDRDRHVSAVQTNINKSLRKNAKQSLLPLSLFKLTVKVLSLSYSTRHNGSTSDLIQNWRRCPPNSAHVSVGLARSCHDAWRLWSWLETYPCSIPLPFHSHSLTRPMLISLSMLRNVMRF